MKPTYRGQGVRACMIFLTLIACAFLWISILTFDPADWPSPKVAPHPSPCLNACGRAGAWLAYQLFFYLGEGTYPLAMCLAGGAILWVFRGQVNHLWQRIFGAALLIAVTAASVHLIGGGYSAPLPEGRGGILGIALGHWLRTNLNTTGTILMLAYCLVVGLVFTSEGLVLRFPAAVRQVGQASSRAIALARSAVEADAAVAVENARAARTDWPAGEPRINTHRAPPPDEADEPAESRSVSDESADQPEHPAEADATQPAAASQARSADRHAEDREPDGPLVTSEGGSASSKADLQTEAEDGQPAPHRLAMRYPGELGEWKLPPLSLLEDPEYVFGVQQEGAVREKAKVLERTLSEFRIEARVVEIDTGPVITFYELRTAPGVKVSQIASLSNDIARALKAPAVRVVAPIPGKSTIGIEVPNVEKEWVRLKELMTISGDRWQKMALPLFIGKDASGNPLLSDLAAMPHLLIAGTTGSGKSVCINSLIMSILMTQRPDRVKLILVDPKMVELSNFKDLPHLMCPIVTDMRRAEMILDWAATKMDERYELLAEAGVRNIAAYNRLTREEILERFQPADELEEARIPFHLPYIVIIIDELADLMMTAAKEVEHHLSRLAQKSRAVGVHIIVATQRPEAKIVTGLIKANLPCRIAFRVASRMDSRIVLDQNGAEGLMGQGDMLFLPPGSAKLIRAQGTFVDDRELQRAIEFLLEQGRPEFHPELVQLRTGTAAGQAGRDELFDQAVRIVLETQRGSVSLLQRKLMIGYSRASRLIDQMAEEGIVGDYKGSQAREVLITLDEWEARRRQGDDAALGGPSASDDEAETPVPV